MSVGRVRRYFVCPAFGGHVAGPTKEDRDVRESVRESPLQFAWDVRLESRGHGCQLEQSNSKLQAIDVDAVGMLFVKVDPPPDLWAPDDGEPEE
jgi:hypothetical protein